LFEFLVSSIPVIICPISTFLINNLKGENILQTLQLGKFLSQSFPFVR
jgi:hypothetical protein